MDKPPLAIPPPPRPVVLDNIIIITPDSNTRFSTAVFQRSS